MNTPHGDILAQLTARGAQLREVRASLMRQTAALRQRWFQGPAGCDLFLWYGADEGLCQIQLTLGDLAVDWDPKAGVRTSRITAFKRDDHSRVVPDKELDDETLVQARALLASAPVDDVTLALVRKRLGLRQPKWR